MLRLVVVILPAQVGMINWSGCQGIRFWPRSSVCPYLAMCHGSRSRPRLPLMDSGKSSPILDMEYSRS